MLYPQLMARYFDLPAPQTLVFRSFCYNQSSSGEVVVEAAASLCETDRSFPSDLQVFFCPLQEFHLSIHEQKILQEIEFIIMKITYKEIVTEDGELMVTASPSEAVQPNFETAVKSYRIREGMSVTFHCRMAGVPLPKVSPAHRCGVAVV